MCRPVTWGILLKVQIPIQWSWGQGFYIPNKLSDYAMLLTWDHSLRSKNLTLREFQ